MILRAPEYKLIVMGASAGALESLYALLPHLPASYPLPIVIVIHLPPDKNSVMVELLQAKIKMKVKEAEDKETLMPATVYLAPPNYHVLVEAGGYLSLSSDEQINYSRPSIDVLFESASEAYGSAVIGVIMSGANHDGAKGLKLIGDTGGRMIVQKPDTAFSSIMPQAALTACPEAQSLPLEHIAAYLQEAVSA